jgi:hypothetical protein
VDSFGWKGGNERVDFSESMKTFIQKMRSRGRKEKRLLLFLLHKK